MLVPAALMLTRMFSMDWAVKAQLVKASIKRLQLVTVLNMFAGNVANEVQLYQVEPKPDANDALSVAAPVTDASNVSAGKLIKDEQLLQAA